MRRTLDSNDFRPPDKSRRYTSSQRWTATTGGPICTTFSGLWILIGFCVFVMRNATDGFSQSLKAGAFAFGSLALLACYVCYLTDPGSPVPDPRDPCADESDDLQRIRLRELPDGRQWKQKWCRECQVWRPHRCGHCHFCQRCVLRLDHHCYWMGTCIGERNHRFFAAYLLFAGISKVLMMVLGIHRMVMLNGWRDIEFVSIVAFLCCCCPPPLCMSLASCYLTCGGLLHTFFLFTDFDRRRCKMGWADFIAEFRKSATCEGVSVYLVSPVAFKTRVKHKDFEPIEEHSPWEADQVEAAEGVPCVPSPNVQPKILGLTTPVPGSS